MCRVSNSKESFDARARERFYQYLRDEYELLKANQKIKSQRDFARLIAVSPGPLSDIFRGRSKWHVSRQRAQEIVVRLSDGDVRHGRILRSIGVDSASLLDSKIESEISRYCNETSSSLEQMLVDLFSQPSVLSQLQSSDDERLTSNEFCSQSLASLWLRLPFEYKAALPDLLATKNPQLAAQYHLSILRQAADAIALPVEKRDLASLLFAGDLTQIKSLRNRLAKLLLKAYECDAQISKADKQLFRFSATLFPINQSVFGISNDVETSSAGRDPLPSLPTTLGRESNGRLGWQRDLVAIMKADFESLKKQSARFSMRAYSARLGLSVAAVSLLFSEKAEWALSNNRATQLLELIEAPAGMKNRILVEMGRHPELEKSHLGDIDLSGGKLFSSLPHLAVMGACYLRKSLRNRNALQEMFGFSDAFLDKVISDLEVNSLIRIDEHGDFLPESKFQESTSGIASEAIKDHHRMILEVCRKVVSGPQMAGRYFGSVAVCLSNHDFELLKADVVSALEEASALVYSPEGANQLFQIAVQIFPDQYASKKTYTR